MPRKKTTHWAGRHHDATITQTEHGKYPWTARRGNGDFCVGCSPTLTDAKHACADWIGDTIEWRTA